MASESPIVFYDIASDEPRRTFAPNPWKTRFALNFKGVPYRTEWVHMPDISAVRQKLQVPANRTLPDGSPYFTLPLIHDVSKNQLVGDTFEIALHLDQAYPDAPQLFRPSTAGLVAALNAHVDGVFTKHVALCTDMPFDPTRKDETLAVFAKRAGVDSFDSLAMSPEQREQTFVSFEAALGELSKAYLHTGGTTDYVWRHGGTDKAQSQRPGRQVAGPFLDGDTPVYADFIIGAWLKMMQTVLKPEEWRRISSWQDGFWGRVVESLDQYAVIK